jgi:hypothetical protein
MHTSFTTSIIYGETQLGMHDRVAASVISGEVHVALHVPSGLRYYPDGHLHSPEYWNRVPHAEVLMHVLMKMSLRSGDIHEVKHYPLTLSLSYGIGQVALHVIPSL